MRRDNARTCVESDLFDVIESIVPQSEALCSQPASVKLSVLGFDSMAIISLFAALEDKLGFPLDALQPCLDRACTLGALLELCRIAG